MMKSNTDSIKVTKKIRDYKMKDYGGYLMDNILKYNKLFDYYGSLLTEKEQIYFKEYYFENLSLSEIALNYNVSRTAIHKLIKSCEIKLEEYESKLGIIKRDEKIKKYLKEIEDERVSKILEIM